MSREVKVNVEYLTRVEGHGNIVVNVREGRLEDCRFEIVEAPRFFEGMLRGRSIFEAPHITSRICGICACGHTLASIQASEDALGFVPSQQTILLRKLLLHMEILDSHILHIYLLAAPDLVGVKSFVPLIQSNEKVVRRALRMKKVCNDVCEILVGRHVHPISATIGGFTKLPTEKELDEMVELVRGLIPDLGTTLELFGKFKFPEFERETEYIALVNDSNEYPLLEGDIGSSLGHRLNKKDYKKVTNEFIESFSSSKLTKFNRDSYAVGAISRFNINYQKLSNMAKDAAKFLNLKPLVINPYLNTLCQLVECFHCVEDSLSILDNLREKGIDKSEEITVGLNENRVIPLRAGNGVGAVEVPRGLLFHNYEIDENGIIQHANCIIPTGQNVNNIQYDMRKLVPEIIDKKEEEITLLLEMLVRAYDPCISCSAHLLDVKFIK